MSNYTLPENKEEWYAKGTFTAVDGQEIYFEIPASFNDDGTCNVEETTTKINNTIDKINNDLNRMSNIVRENINE